HANIESIVAWRRRNYETLVRELSGSNMRPLFPMLPSTGCPWIFPVVFPGIGEAHLVLRRHGIPAVNWEGVRHPQVPFGRFDDVDFLYRNLVFLPVHQSLQDEQIVKLARKVRELCAK